jgi:hypothetical protein
MYRPPSRRIAATLLCLSLVSMRPLMASAAGAAPAAPAAVPVPPAAPRTLVGPVTREQVEAAVPEWVQVEVDSKPELAAARALALVEPGAEVTVLLGTWCGDSRREISRLWRALDDVGAAPQGGPAGGLPFTIRYIGVDEAKQQPEAEVKAAGLLYVPTLIVSRGGHEVGRIVERPPHGVEADLLALLTGKAAGLLTASPKMPHQGAPSPR